MKTLHIPDGLKSPVVAVEAYNGAESRRQNVGGVTVAELSLGT